MNGSNRGLAGHKPQPHQSVGSALWTRHTEFESQTTVVQVASAAWGHRVRWGPEKGNDGDGLKDLEERSAYGRDREYGQART